MRSYSRIKTSFPVTEQPAYFLSGGHCEQGYIMLDADTIFKACPDLKNAHQLLLSSDPIGRVGNYKGVFELIPAVEAYTPDEGSNPGEGIVGVEELMRIIIFKTYFDPTISADLVDLFLQKLSDLHPWEHPLIELISDDGTKILTSAKR